MAQAPAATIQHAAAAVTRARPTRCSCTARSTSARGDGSVSPTRRDGSLRPIDNYYTFGLDTPAKTYALWYQRYMHEFGVTNEDFGQYTVVARKHAATNPAAWFYQRPITIEDHQASRWIVEPILRKLDCCQESDGGVALVITRADRADDLPNPAVRLAADLRGALRHGHVMYNYYWDDIARVPRVEGARRPGLRVGGRRPRRHRRRHDLRELQPGGASSSSRASASAGRARPRTSSPTATSTSTARHRVNPHGGLLGEAYIHGVNNVARGHAPDPRHRGQPDQGRGARAVRHWRGCDHPHSGVMPGILTPA